MFEYPIHTVDTAPEGSRGALRDLKREVGMIPNLAASMAESPELLRGFANIREIFYGGSFTPAEIQILALTNAFENGCRYCMSLHSKLAQSEGVSAETLTALRRGESPMDPRSAVLSDFSRRLVRERGRVREADLTAFENAGFTAAQALEVVLGVAVSILANFSHHLTDCPIDDAFQSTKWDDCSDDAARSGFDHG